MNYPNKTDTATLKAHLLADVSRLVDCLFAGRTIQRTAHEIRIGNNGSISIRLDDGSYYDHESGTGGDILAMIQHTLKTSFMVTVLFAQDFLGKRPLSPIPHANRTNKKPDDYAVKQREKALAMLERSVPIYGTLAEDYLREKRGIAVGVSSVVRFMPHAFNFSTSKEHPAMIAPIQDVKGDVIAAHCTFLDPTTGNKLGGDGIKPRLIFGACSGGAIRLSPLKKKVIVCEGVEDGLSILQSIADACVWVSAGTSGMQNLQLPISVSEVIIAMDNDPEGAGQRAATSLAEQLKKKAGLPV